MADEQPSRAGSAVVRRALVVVPKAVPLAVVTPARARGRHAPEQRLTGSTAGRRGRVVVGNLLRVPDHDQFSSSPESSAITWEIRGVRVAMPSRTAAREAARLTTSVEPETPTRPRESPASTAPAASPEARIASAMPGMGGAGAGGGAGADRARGEPRGPPTVTRRPPPPMTAVLSALRIATDSPGTT